MKKSISPDAKFAKIKEEEKKEIVKKVVARLYSPEKIKEKMKKKDNNLKYDYDADLRCNIHRLDREIRISKMSTAGTVTTHQNRLSNVSKWHTKGSYSLQSYNMTTEERNTDEAETIVTTEHETEVEDRCVTAEQRNHRNKHDISSKNSGNTYITENYQIKGL